VRAKRYPDALPLTAGYTPGVPRLGVPALLSSDASMGITNPGIPPRWQGRHGDERMRVLGFERVELHPGVSRQVTVTADPRLLATFDGTAGQWRIAEGIHRIPLAHRADEPVRGRSIDQQADS
jgi:hypothetical protein